MRQPPDGVSIVITSYNYEAFIGRAIESAASQDVAKLDIVVVDNASTDGSWGIIERAAERDARIRAFRHNSNIGMIANHNSGTERAKHEHVLFLSADDYLLPGHVARLLAAHAKHPEIDYVYSSHIRVDEQQRFLNYCNHPGFVQAEYAGGRNEFADLLTYDCYMCLATTLFSRDNLLSTGGFREGLVAGDLDLYVRLAATEAQFAFVNAPGVAIGLHPGERSGEERYVATGKQLLDHLDIMEQHVTAENRHLYRGREHGIARLLQAKIGNARRYPQGLDVLEGVQARIQAITDRLFSPTSSAHPNDPAAAISVIVLGSSDVEATMDAIKMVVQQKQEGLEVVIVDRGSFDATAFLDDRARPFRAKLLHLGDGVSETAAISSGMRLTNADVVTYVRPGIRWAPDHIANLTAIFASPKVETVLSPVQLVPAGRSTEPGAAVNLIDLGIADIIPLEALAHRRSLFDRLGEVDARFGQLSEGEFATRIVAGSQTLSQPVPIVAAEFDLRRSASALRDPHGYVAALHSFHSAYDVPAEARERRERHVERITLALNTALAARTPANQEQLELALRGYAT
ncbi:MAG TPA: glycosyltransferase family 2 protein [Candidatus Baltobacteraceae bacterium]|nr:glycosyltransferase family 2 protein [Candidatus Baltobacteraceae bacterium]